MLFILRSSFRFSASSAASPGVLGPVTEVPPAARVDVDPTRPDVVAADDPDEFAVPAAFVPGVCAALAALPAPLGSLTELLEPPALPGPMGTPLTPAVPAPAEPALGDPAAVPVPADEPLAAPPAEAPLADPPPAEPPPPPPL
jgi:hypothetical protein